MSEPYKLPTIERIKVAAVIMAPMVNLHSTPDELDVAADRAAQSIRRLELKLSR